MRGCLAPPKNSAQTTGRGAAGCFFAPQTAPRRTQQGKKRASALVAVSRLLKMAATNVLFPNRVSSPIVSRILDHSLCASVFQDPSLLDTQPRSVNTEAQREQSWNVELRPRVGSGIRRSPCSPFAAALSFRTLAIETQDSARTL
jgi:hypothetical protein